MSLSLSFIVYNLLVWHFKCSFDYMHGLCQCKYLQIFTASIRCSFRRWNVYEINFPLNNKDNYVESGRNWMCEQCKKLKSLEDGWIIKFYHPFGINKGDKIMSKVRIKWWSSYTFIYYFVSMCFSPLPDQLYFPV